MFILKEVARRKSPCRCAGSESAVSEASWTSNVIIIIIIIVIVIIIIIVVMESVTELALPDAVG